jgi:hypothetical protein
METIGRNAPCPCGSGKKYKNCCLPKDQAGPELPNLANFRYALRMKGGVRYDPEAGGFVVIVHTWDNAECRGEPQEYRYEEVFAREEEALRYYKTKIGPKLIRFMEQNAAKSKTATFIHRKLE